MKWNQVQLLSSVIIVMLSCNTGSAGKAKEETPVTAETSATTKEEPAAYQYDLDHPQKKWVLPQELFEISGNTYIDKNHLLVIEDLHPNLYLVRLNDTSATIEKTIPFKEGVDKKFDIEDVTMANGIVYALWSHGSIFKIKDWQGKPEVTEIKTFLKKDNNTEGICYDPVSKNLLVACKNNSDVEDEKKSTRAVYPYNIAKDELKEEPFLLIHHKDFKTLEGESIEFYPSAIAVHPVTHDIYILSTKGTKCMAVYSYNGKLKELKFINKELMPQPEGLCFSPEGTLYISTEGKQGGMGQVLQYNYSTK